MAGQESRARVLNPKTEENKKNSSCSLPLPREGIGDQEVRARAQACFDSGVLDDWKLRPVVTILSQRRPPSRAQVEALEECEAFVWLMREAQKKREEQAEKAAESTKKAAVTLAGYRGYFSEEAMRERLAAYQRIAEERGEDEAIRQRVADLNARLRRVHKGEG